MGAAESTGRPNGTIEREEEGGSFTEKVATAATLAAGVAVAVAAWGISEILSRILSRILSDNTDSQAIKSPTPKRENQPSIRAPPPPDRFKISTKGESSGYGGIISHNDGDYLHFSSDVVQKYSVWRPPPRGRFKMNTDGACKPNPGPSGGYGGILRNNHGDFVYGFYGFIDRKTDGLTAEFHGIHKGLKLLNKLGYMGSILETDCKAAFEWVTEEKNGPSKSDIIYDCWGIIEECRKLIRINKIEVEKIVGKHANKCADKLAAMVLKEEEEYMEFEYVPREIKSFVDKDKSIKCL